MRGSLSVLAGLLVMVSLLGGRSALGRQADDEEPTPPAERKAKRNGAKPRSGSVAPAAASATAPSPTEPRLPLAEASSGASPGGSRGALYGIGFHARALFVPEWLQNAFLASSNAINSGALSVQFIRRKGNFDLVANLDFGFYSPPDGTYLAKNKQPELDANYIQFRNLDVLGLEVAFVWHHELLPWLSLIYGGGVGLGFVLGDIYRIHDFAGNCHADNLKNYRRCNPVSPTDVTGQFEWNANRNAWLNAHAGSGSDTAAAPHFYREDGVWPVVPILHLLAGFDFKIGEQLGVQVHGGFHTVAFYLGATGLYFF